MPRFTIRDVLFVTAIVAISTGWLVDRWRWEDERGDFITRMFRRDRESRDVAEIHRRRIRRLETALEKAGVPIPQEPTMGELMNAIEKSHLK